MLRGLTPTGDDGALVVGPEDNDDAAVWRLDEDRVLIATVDFITPLVDDAETWGCIAATNSVSDVYAMGGRPLFGLNLVGWNREELPLELLEKVLAGAATVAQEGGWAIAGGHTIDDPEPKFGLAVVGEAHPDELVRVSGLREGDSLVLTKPVGTGVVTTALKSGEATPEAVEDAVMEMSRSNASAARAAREAGANGGTDVTGFGLLGHLRNMLEASQVAAELNVRSVPLLTHVRDLVEAGHVPGGTRRNLDWVRDFLDVPDEVNETTLTLLADAQTSGGLLFGATPEAAQQAVMQLVMDGHTAAIVGRVVAGTPRLQLG